VISAAGETTLRVASGNRCGHDPSQPRFFRPPDVHAPRPKILQRLLAALPRYYEAPQTVLPSLNAANGSARQQRTERREACLLMLGAVIHYTDLVTLRVGIPQADGSIAGLTLHSLAGLSGLTLRRAERALQDIKVAGILSVQTLCNRTDTQTFRGMPAIRTLSHEFFTVFGLERWLLHERRKAKERQSRKVDKQARKALAQVRMANSAIDQAKPRRHSENRGSPSPGPQPLADYFADLRQGLGLAPSG